MKIIDAGHAYLLAGYDGGTEQRLVFLKREGEGFPFNCGAHGGTNCQEVLRALIDRSEYLNRQIPSAETEAILGALRTALFLFESRAARRHCLELELADLHAAVRLPSCETCGHLVCPGH